MAGCSVVHEGAGVPRDDKDAERDNDTADFNKRMKKQEAMPGGEV